MNDLRIFNNEEFGEVRTAVINDEPMFCLADICRVLEIKNVSDCKSRLRQKGIVTTDTLTNGGKQKMIFIDESNLYKTIFQSRKESAERFTDWVTGEVLPSIRKTGSYNKPMTTAEKIQLLAQGNEELNERVDKVEDKIDSLENDMPLYGCVSSYKSIKRKYIADVHEFIDCYLVPTYLGELINGANAQQSFI